jgi:hypothetical protein
VSQDFYPGRLAGHGQAYRDVIGRLVDRGAAGVILGRTEIELLIGQKDSLVLVSPRPACTPSRRSTTPWGLPGCQGLLRVSPDPKVRKAT